MSLKLDERKICAVALAKLMAHDEVRQNQQLFSQCCAGLVTLLGLTPTSTAAVAEEAGSDDEQPAADGGAGQEYEVSFNKLRNTDLPGAAAGLAPDVPDLHAAARQLLQPQGAAIGQLCQANPELQ